jgi:hypothetical protein
MLDLLTISALLLIQYSANLENNDKKQEGREPQGLLDCSFDERNVYICRKEKPNDKASGNTSVDVSDKR